jgi:soluble lytic murein transglycosylase-like protein
MKISVAEKQSPVPQTTKASKDEREIKLLKLKKACQDFESIFIYYMLKSMRSSDSKSNMFGEGLGSDIFQQMFDQGLADKMASSGQLDIASSMYNKYAAVLGAQETAKQEATPIHEITTPIISKSTIAPQVAPAVTQPAASIENNKTTSIAETPTELKIASVPISIPEAKADATIVVDKPTTTAQTISKKAARQKAAVDAYHDIITDAATANNVDPNLVKALILQESGGNPKAISAKGAKGLMQIMDGTAKMLGVDDPYDIKQNIEGGVKYLADLINKFGGDIKNALAAYNAGPAAVQKYGGIPPYDETTDFVDSVMKHFNGLFNLDKSR